MNNRVDLDKKEHVEADASGRVFQFTGQGN